MNMTVMPRRVHSIALLTLLLAAPSAAHGPDLMSRVPQTERQAGGPQPEQLIIGGTVRRIVGFGIFILEDPQGADGELLVLTPDAEVTPSAGATVLARGIYRRFDMAELQKIPGWNEIDARTRDVFAARPVLFATSLTTAAGVSLMRSASRARPGTPFVRRLPAAPSPPPEIRLHPGGLAALIGEVGGRSVALRRARVLAVVNPRVVLVESGSPLMATIGNLSRVLVLIKDATLHVDATAMVGSDVEVVGVARTLLGVQASREVPWPPELTPQMVKRLEIRAAVLAASVHTADGVELTVRQTEP